MNIDPNVVRNDLREEFERQAKYRSRKAEDHPDDPRNAEAAEIFNKLAASTKDVDPAVLQAHIELCDQLPDSEFWSEMMKRVGFHYWPETAEEFCRTFIADRTGG